MPSTNDLKRVPSSETDPDRTKTPASECRSCANWRSAIAGILCLIALAWTGPNVLDGPLEGADMVVFILAFCALPALLIKNGVLLMRAVKKIPLR